ncbi:hypothetical protein T310_4527 [Rasamsonia emersonii CBS 393.64]|uniref:Transcription factor domain-containing protein n=1 Tax=Rasamsonia emersonii (strain ATCC 16479 / CBS 393.64 / IMI 116815) TaxID=1408163 RepID=A0A0F4YUY9_RASE3|nr:hypothetical protein T310_4527 [Rasamsonia emersonii CBS 393.64]KKA21448.1 hypothetical protein T310_4527 [Rasamsonia emersonii CBS 393.64]
MVKDNIAGLSPAERTACPAEGLCPRGIADGDRLRIEGVGPGGGPRPDDAEGGVHEDVDGEEKRGPKFRRAAPIIDPATAPRNNPDGTGETGSATRSPPKNERWRTQDYALEAAVWARKLSWIINEYHNQSYSVWPVIKSDVLLDRLSLPFDANTYCLAAALCAATMAQLNLPAVAVEEDNLLIDSGYLARECIRIREQHSYREHLDVRSALASFFLHVYHAKVNKRNSAMMFIQEAISSAKLLGLDRDNRALQEPAGDVVDNGEILFSLLWVSERGYAMHLGLSPSYAQSFCVPVIESSPNVHVHGLLELARLFATFDQCSDAMVSEELLIASETALQGLSMNAENAALRVDEDDYLAARAVSGVALVAGFVGIDVFSLSCPGQPGPAECAAEFFIGGSSAFGAGSAAEVLRGRERSGGHVAVQFRIVGEFHALFWAA